ncbi:MAG: hypothetical protein IT244_04290 [Bacteroidia bacterium]|nr:hypothetical protein [Bacteroidia bacterium]
MNTKNSIAVVLCLMASSLLKSQNINYKLLQNDPENYIPKFNLNLEFMQLDGAFNNIMGMSFNAGVWGNVQIAPRIGIDFGARKSYLSFAPLVNKEMAGNTDLTAGAFLFPIKKAKTKKMQVVLSSSRGTNKMGETVETTRFIMAPGTKLKFAGVHAGVMYKRTGFDLQDLIKDLDDSKLEHTNYTTGGIYAGYIFRQLTNLVLDVEGYGKRFHSVAREFYADITYNPINNFQKFTANPLDEKTYNTNIKNATNEGAIGYKIGWRTYQIAPKSVTGKKFGLSGAFEAGKRPYLGWFVSGSVGLTLFKK